MNALDAAKRIIELIEEIDEFIEHAKKMKERKSYDKGVLERLICKTVEMQSELTFYENQFAEIDCYFEIKRY